jgi:hypothetical protein
VIRTQMSEIFVDTFETTVSECTVHTFSALFLMRKGARLTQTIRKLVNVPSV